ncbi:MAG: outer membrane protein TolC [bacterium]|jgi:outer membrane protein TolC
MNKQTRSFYSPTLLRGISFIVIILICCTSVVLANSQQGYMKALQQFQQEEPDLFKRIKVLKENNKDVFAISLRDILYLVLKRSISIQATQLQEKISLAMLRAKQDKDHPTLTTSFSYGKAPTISSTSLSSSSTVTFLDTLTSTISSTLSKKTSQGITFSSTIQRTQSQSTIYNLNTSSNTLVSTSKDDPLEYTSLSMTAAIPLFQDWGGINNISIDRSKITLQQTKIGTERSKLQILDIVGKTYWDLVGIREQIKAFKEAVSLSLQLVKDNKIRVQLGVLDFTDLKQSETQLANNQRNLLSVQIKEQQVLDQIRTFLDLEELPFGIIPSELPKIHKKKYQHKKEFEKVTQNHPNFKLILESLKSNRLDLNNAQNKDKTNLDLSLKYTFNGYGSATSETFSTYSQSTLQGYTVGLTWTLPLADKATPQKIIRRKIERQKLLLQKADLTSQLNVQLQSITRNLRFGVKELKIAQVAVSASKELLSKEVEKFRSGKSTSFNVSQAQQNHTQAKLSKILVRIRNEQHFISLLILTGDIFPHFNLNKI